MLQELRIFSQQFYKINSVSLETNPMCSQSTNVLHVFPSQSIQNPIFFLVKYIPDAPCMVYPVTFTLNIWPSYVTIPAAWFVSGYDFFMSFSWLVVYLSLWKIWVRQLGWLFHSQHFWENKIHVPVSTNQDILIIY